MSACDGCVDLSREVEKLKRRCADCRTMLKWAMNLRRTNPVAAWDEVERLARRLEEGHG